MAPFCEAPAEVTPQDHAAFFKHLGRRPSIRQPMDWQEWLRAQAKQMSNSAWDTTLAQLGVQNLPRTREAKTSKAFRRWMAMQATDVIMSDTEA